jgi:hypothetical protein
METSVMPVDPTIAVGMLKPDASPKENMKGDQTWNMAATIYEF